MGNAPRVTIIGSGAVALAVLDELSGRSDVHVTLVRPGKRLAPRLADPASSPEEEAAFVRNTIAALRSSLGFKFPPPKSQFGALPSTTAVRGWGRVWRSDLHGGLTQFWGGSMVPFTDRELADWPIAAADLADFYALVGRGAGITGRDDAVRADLRDDYADLPPVSPVAPIAAFIDRLGHREAEGFDLMSGASRVAVETRPERANACVHSGHCMTGCGRDAIFSALPRIERYVAAGAVTEVVAGMVERIDPERKRMIVREPGGGAVERSYETLFICAGCLQSVELVTRSFGIDAEAPVTDNHILSFPVFFTGSLPKERDPAKYFALTNGICLVRPRDPAEPAIFIQLYPNPDYFWRYNLPGWLWPPMKGVARAARDRFFWARAYLSSGQSQCYRLDRGADGTAEWTLARAPDTSGFRARVWPELRRVLASEGFWVPPLDPAGSKTSSHYAGGFPMGGRFLDAGGRLADGVYLCDSANFPSCAALSHTFTAMANARRIARAALA